MGWLEATVGRGPPIQHHSRRCQTSRSRERAHRYPCRSADLELVVHGAMAKLRPSDPLLVVVQVAIYSRVSTERQEREQTIESQLAVLRTWAEANGHTIQPEHVFLDEVYSGAR